MTETRQLTKPATALLVGGIVLALFDLFGLIVAFSNRMESMYSSTGMSDGAIMLLSALGKLNGIVGLLLSGVVIAGSFAMMKQTSYGLSKAGGICAIIGGVLAGLLGWLFVLPFGIWAVVTLRKPEARRLFDRSTAGNFSTP